MYVYAHIYIFGCVLNIKNSWLTIEANICMLNKGLLAATFTHTYKYTYIDSYVASVPCLMCLKWLIVAWSDSNDLRRLHTHIYTHIHGVWKLSVFGRRLRIKINSMTFFIPIFFYFFFWLLSNERKCISRIHKRDDIRVKVYKMQKPSRREIK